MHGRPRKPPTPEDASASAAKSAKLRELQIQILHNHRHHIYTQEALAASLKLLEINPEVLYGWNYRKLALQHNLGEAVDPKAVRSLVDEELRVMEIALRKNPKSYGTWHHRKWVMGQRISPMDSDCEFWLIDQLLTGDPRNFHGWSYWRFIDVMKDVPEEEELQFMMKMIDRNFNNYSAWHNRGVLLSRLLEQKYEGYVSREEILTKEYDLVHHTLFTDPGDQSGWFYYIWLLDQTVNPDLLLTSSWHVEGSDCALTVNGNMGFYKFIPLSSSSSYYSLHTGMFPIILSSSTITVKSALKMMFLFGRQYQQPLWGMLVVG